MSVLDDIFVDVMEGPPTAETLAKRAKEREVERAKRDAEQSVRLDAAMAERAKAQAEAHERSRVKPCPSEMDENSGSSRLYGIGEIKERLRSPASHTLISGGRGSRAKIVLWNVEGGLLI
jgi:hypothetical protein